MKTKTILIFLMVLLGSLAVCDEAEEDSNLAKLDKGYAEYERSMNYWNGSDYVPSSYLLKVVLLSEKISLDGNEASGTGDVLILGMNSESSGSLTAGSYSGFDYETRFDGYIQYGDYYMDMDAATINDGIQNYEYDSKGWLISGSVGVSKSGEAYTFDIDLSDLHGDFVLQGEAKIPSLPVY